MLNAYHLACILLAFHEDYGGSARVETRERVLESVAHELAVDGESALGDFTFCICSFYFDVYDISFYLNIYAKNKWVTGNKVTFCSIS